MSWAEEPDPTGTEENSTETRRTRGRFALGPGLPDNIWI